MYASELLAKLRHLTLSGENDEGEFEFIGTFQQWQKAAAEERKILGDEDSYWDNLRDERCST